MNKYDQAIQQLQRIASYHRKTAEKVGGYDMSGALQSQEIVATCETAIEALVNEQIREQEKCANCKRSEQECFELLLYPCSACKHTVRLSHFEAKGINHA